MSGYGVSFKSKKPVHRKIIVISMLIFLVLCLLKPLAKISINCICHLQRNTHQMDMLIAVLEITESDGKSRTKFGQFLLRVNGNFCSMI